MIESSSRALWLKKIVKLSDSFFFDTKLWNTFNQTNKFEVQQRWQNETNMNNQIQSAWINSSKAGGQTPTHTWEASLLLARWASSWAALLYSLFKLSDSPCGENLNSNSHFYRKKKKRNQFQVWQWDRFFRPCSLNPS